MCVVVTNTAMLGTHGKKMAQPPLSSRVRLRVRALSVHVESGCVENVPLNFLLVDVHSLKTAPLQTVPAEIN